MLLSDDKTQNLGTLPSRLITMVKDRGTLEFDPNVDKKLKPYKMAETSISKVSTFCLHKYYKWLFL